MWEQLKNISCRRNFFKLSEQTKTYKLVEICKTKSRLWKEVTLKQTEKNNPAQNMALKI